MEEKRSRFLAMYYRVTQIFALARRRRHWPMLDSIADPSSLAIFFFRLVGCEPFSYGRQKDEGFALRNPPNVTGLEPEMPQQPQQIIPINHNK